MELLKRVVNELRMAGINLLGVVMQQRKRNDIYGYHYSKYYSESKTGKKKAGLSLKRRKKTDDLTSKRIEEEDTAL